MSQETKEQLERQIKEEANTISAARKRQEELKAALEVIQSTPAVMFGCTRLMKHPRIFIKDKIFDAGDGMDMTLAGMSQQYDLIYDLVKMWANGATPIWAALTVEEAECFVAMGRWKESNSVQSILDKIKAALAAYKE